MSYLDAEAMATLERFVSAIFRVPKMADTAEAEVEPEIEGPSRG